MKPGRHFSSVASAFFALFFALFPLSAAAQPRTPSDVYFGDQWYLERIGAPDAWNTSIGFEGVTVAVIDSGVDTAHPDLKDNIWRNPGEVADDGIDNDLNGYVDDVRGWDFVAEDNDPRPELAAGASPLNVSHGTINAGIIAAKGDNRAGIAGVTWQTAIMPLRALDANGEGDPNGVVRAVEYAMKNGAKIINVSFVGRADNPLLRIAFRRAYEQGVFIVAAAGNAPDGAPAIDLDRDPLYPVCIDRETNEDFIFGVAATDQLDRRAEFSNYGGCVDIAAPGVRFISTQLFRPGTPGFEEPYGGFFNGTSLAAPVVSGVAALMRAMDRNLTPRQIGDILRASAKPVGVDPQGINAPIGAGRVSAAKAVAQVLELQRAVPTPVATSALLPVGSSGRIIVAGAGAGRPADVRLFTEDGLFVREFRPFPDAFRGGVSLATADFQGQGRKAIIIGAGSGGGPQVRIYDANTKEIGGFFAYDERFRGGVNVAAGDLDGDGKDEIITGAGPGGGPHVRVFGANGVAVGGFFAFDKTFKGGVGVAAGDLDGDGKDEIVVASDRSGNTVRVFTAKGQRIAEFRPFGASHRNGIRVTVADVDRDGRNEIVVQRPVIPGTAVVFAQDGRRLATIDGEGRVSPIRFAPTAFSPRIPERPLLLASPRGVAPTVFGRILGPVGFTAFEPKFRGGVSVGVLE